MGPPGGGNGGFGAPGLGPPAHCLAPGFWNFGGNAMTRSLSERGSVVESVQMVANFSRVESHFATRMPLTPKSSAIFSIGHARCGWRR